MLFRQLERSGSIICSCAEAIVYEFQEASRRLLRWQIRREYRSGWLYSYIRNRENGAVRAFIAALRSCVLGSGKLIVRCLLRFYEPRVAALILARGLASQSGKLAFFGLQAVEEYKERP